MSSVVNGCSSRHATGYFVEHLQTAVQMVESEPSVSVRKNAFTKSVASGSRNRSYIGECTTRVCGTGSDRSKNSL